MSFISYFEKFLTFLGFKKFMWMHVTGLVIISLMIVVGLVEVVISGTFKAEEAIIALGGFIVAYIVLKVFQAVIGKKVLEDSYMFLWTGDRRRKKN